MPSSKYFDRPQRRKVRPRQLRFRSTVWNGSLVVKLTDVCSNDNAPSIIGDISRVGIEFQRRAEHLLRAPQREVVHRRLCNEDGRYDGLRLFGVYGQKLQFPTFMTGIFAPEFPTLDEVHINACAQRLPVGGFYQGSRNGYELYVAAGQQFQVDRGQAPTAARSQEPI